MHTMHKRNLVIVRAGANSLHSSWLPRAGQAASWDLHISAYDESVLSTFSGQPGITASFETGTKGQGISACLSDLSKRLPKYDFFFFPDDDLAMTCLDINNLFDCARAHNLSLCQPSLTEDSFVAHPITKHVEGLLLRYTSFVEVMCPCFSLYALLLCKRLFKETISSWGIDLLFPAFLGYPVDKIAIIDSVRVKHTRPPMQGDNIPLAVSLGVSPEEEVYNVLAKYGIPFQDEWPYLDPDLVKVYSCVRRS